MIHEKIMNDIQKKKDLLKQDFSNNLISLETYTFEIEKYNRLTKLLQQKLNSFFSSLSITFAYQILQDLGYGEDVPKIYCQLLTEELSNEKVYELVDTFVHK